MVGMIDPLNKSTEHEEGTDYVDIINILCDSSTTGLSASNPTMQAPHFSLHDSMAALQVMSPSMDCCAMPLSNLIVPSNLSQLPFDDLSVADVAAIVIKNLIVFEALLNGSNVLDSTYTCLYVHDCILREMHEKVSKFGKSKEVDKYEAHHFALYASTVCLVKMSDLVHGLVTHADIYEEEDFDTKTLGVNFGRGIIDFDENQSLTDLMENSLYLLKTDLSFKNDLAVAELSMCLTAQLSFYQICARLGAIMMRGHSTSSIVSEFNEAMDAITQATLLFNNLLEYANKNKDREIFKENHITEKVFSVYVNRTMMGNAPVRHARFKEAINCISTLGDIVRDFGFVVNIVIKASTYDRLKRMLRKKSQYSSLNILVRSLSTMALYFNELILGQFDPVSFVRDAMLSKDIPKEVLESSYIDSFISRMVKPLYDSLKLFTLSKFRQKEFIDSLILKDWGILQQEAKAIDFHTREDNETLSRNTNFPLTNWVLQETLEFMEKSISLAIETELYREELDSVFWYRDFILSTHINILNNYRKAIKDRDDTSNEACSQHGKKKKDKRNALKPILVSATEHEDNVEYVLTSVKRTICRGIFRFMMAIRQNNLSPLTDHEFTSRETIINKRFEQFSCIDQPSLLTYDDFIQGSDFSKVDPQRLVAAALECFDAGKLLIDQLIKTLDVVEDESFVSFHRSDAAKLKKICVGNTVFLQKLGNISKEGNTSQRHTINFEFDHKEFCIIKITEKR